MPVLIFETGPDKGKTITLEAGRLFEIGRDPRSDIVLDDELVSRVHAKIRGKDGRYFIKDTGSSNGTRVNDELLDGPHELGSGDRLGIGTTNLSFFADRDAGGGVGRTLGGYKLLQRLGRGGMGTVYRAVQLSLNREVALKILSPELSKNPSFVERFLKEARAAGQLNHPNIVQVYDVHRDGGLIFYAMEYVPGGTVEDRINKSGRMDAADALRLLLDAARGLQYAELKKIVHRDIKPDNLMLTDLGAVKIADLGLAHSLHEGTSETGIIGTPHFISPEQARGQALDIRSDLYSLGATYYRMLTARTMFHGDNAKEIVRQQVKSEPPALKELRSDLPDLQCDIFHKLVRKNPAERYQSAAALIEDIEKAQAGSSANPVAWAAALVLIAVAGILAAIFWPREDTGNGTSTANPPIVVTTEHDNGASEEMAATLRQQQRELDAMRALNDISESLPSLSQVEQVAALETLSRDWNDTDAAAKAASQADEIKGRLQAKELARIERLARIDQAVASMNDVVTGHLAEDRFIEAARAIDLAGGASEVDAAAEKLTEAQSLLRADLLAAIATAEQAWNAEVATALSEHRFADARASTAARTQLLDAVASLHDDSHGLKERLTALAGSLASTRDRVDAMERQHRTELLRTDLALICGGFDWTGWSNAVRELRFGDAATSLEQLADRTTTDAYRDHLLQRVTELRDADRLFQEFVDAAENGTLANTEVRHPERNLLTRIVGISDERDGVVVEVSRAAGSARSIVRFRSFATVDALVNLLRGRVSDDEQDRVAIVRAALMLAAAQLVPMVRGVDAQLATYDPSIGWQELQRRALQDMSLPDLDSPDLQELVSSCGESTEAAQTAAHLLREREAHQAFLIAFAPFYMGGEFGFTDALPLLEEFIAEHRATDFFMMMYPLFDGGRFKLQLVNDPPP